MTAPLPTPQDVAGMRERHYETYAGECNCGATVWPCDAARLLALVDTLSGTVADLELANSRIRDRENERRDRDARWIATLETAGQEQRERLAAVLAECDRLDDVTHLMGSDDEEVAIDHLDRIRRLATGEGS